MGDRSYRSRKPLRLRWHLLLSAPFFLCLAQPAPAAPLRDFIGDLYGGQGITVRPPTGATLNHVAHFQNESLEALNALNKGIASGATFNSFTSSVVGLTFDAAQGLPVRTVESLGPLVGERADTLGAQRFNIGFSYSHIRYTSFNGTSLDNLAVNLAHDTLAENATLPPVCNPNPATQCVWLNDQIHVGVDVRIRQDIFAFSGTYGLTPDWDVGFILPIVDMDARVSANANIIYGSTTDACPVPGGCTHRFDPASPYFDAVPGEGGAYQNFRDTRGGSASGIGDLLLRTKYNFLKGMEMLPDAAVIGQVRLPTGDENNLLGTGSTDFLGMIAVSKQFGIVAPHLNIGYEVASGGFDRSNLRYAAGVDVRVVRDLTLAADIFGRDERHGSNLTDFAIGAKWSVFDRGIITGNFIIPVNKDTGLRPDYIWTVGAEIDF